MYRNVNIYLSQLAVFLHNIIKCFAKSASIFLFIKIYTTESRILNR